MRGKYPIIVLIVTALLFTAGSVSAAAQKVMWGKTELKVGQIGKVTVLSETPIYQFKNNTFVKTGRSLKKGDEYRVYSYKGQDGGYYGLGGGLFVKKSNAVKYETPSKAKLALLAGQSQSDSVGKVYPDGWVAPVLKSKGSSDAAKNYQILQNELGFANGGTRYNIQGQTGAIQVIYQGPDASYEVGINFRGWDGDANGAIPQAYRVPIVAKELFKLYFEGDADRVWNYLNDGFKKGAEIPDNFTANGRSVHVTYSINSGVLRLEISKK